MGVNAGRGEAGSEIVSFTGEIKYTARGLQDARQIRFAHSNKSHLRGRNSSKIESYIGHHSRHYMKHTSNSAHLGEIDHVTRVCNNAENKARKSTFDDRYIELCSALNALFELVAF
jgi:hypothetical protein